MLFLLLIDFFQKGILFRWTLSILLWWNRRRWFNTNSEIEIFWLKFMECKVKSETYVGSHSPGGRTVTASRNSSTPANKWSRRFARYATSWNISSDIRVAMARPISWKLSWLPTGPNSINKNLSRDNEKKTKFYCCLKMVRLCVYLVGIGTSVKSPIIDALFKRKNADSVLSKNSTSPTKMLLASAPGGIFFIKCVLTLCGSHPLCNSDELALRAIDILLGLFTKSSPFCISWRMKKKSTKC